MTPNSRADDAAPVERKSLPYADVAVAYGPLLAPLTLALTGTLYLSGFAWFSVQLEVFGLTNGLFSIPIQTVLAFGFLPLMILTPGIAVVGWIGWSLLKGRIKFRIVEPPNPEDSRIRILLRTVMQFYDMIGRGYFYYVVSLTVLGYAVFAGAGWGWVTADAIWRDVASGCRGRCFIYTTEKRELLGRIIIQDPEKTAIYTSRGVVLVSSDGISDVKPATPELVAKFWRTQESLMVAPPKAVPVKTH